MAQMGQCPSMSLHHWKSGQCREREELCKLVHWEIQGIVSQEGRILWLWLPQGQVCHYGWSPYVHDRLHAKLWQDRKGWGAFHVPHTHTPSWKRAQSSGPRELQWEKGYKTNGLQRYAVLEAHPLPTHVWKG